MALKIGGYRGEGADSTVSIYLGVQRLWSEHILIFLHIYLQIRVYHRYDLVSSFIAEKVHGKFNLI